MERVASTNADHYWDKHPFNIKVCFNNGMKKGHCNFLTHKFRFFFLYNTDLKSHNSEFFLAVLRRNFIYKSQLPFVFNGRGKKQL